MDCHGSFWAVQNDRFKNDKNPQQIDRFDKWSNSQMTFVRTAWNESCKLNSELEQKHISSQIQFLRNYKDLRSNPNWQFCNHRQLIQFIGHIQNGNFACFFMTRNLSRMQHLCDAPTTEIRVLAGDVKAWSCTTTEIDSCNQAGKWSIPCSEGIQNIRLINKIKRKNDGDEKNNERTFSSRVNDMNIIEHTSISLNKLSFICIIGGY